MFDIFVFQGEVALYISDEIRNFKFPNQHELP